MKKQLYRRNFATPGRLKRALLPALAVTLLLGACKKEILQLPNPNAPTPQSSLITEGGIDAFAQGIFYKWIAFETGDGNLNFFDIAWYIESNMGDEDFTPYSNFGSRYPMNISTITLPASYNVAPVKNPSGFNTQLDILRSFNTRAAGDGNSIQYEWDCFYFINAQANTLLAALSNPDLKLTGDAATKVRLLQAWAYYWKGYSYSKIGSMYLAGVIDDSPDSTAKGLTSGLYVPHDQMIAAGNKNFDQAASIFGTITENADYDATFKLMIPTFNQPGNIITPAMWIRNIKSFEARNYMANHKVATMTSTDWTNIQTLAAAGMQTGDYTLMWGSAPAGVPDLTKVGYPFHPMILHTVFGGLSFVSERLIQDIMPGDNRLTAFKPFPGGSVVNVLSRGIQFGTRFAPVDFEDTTAAYKGKGRYATENYDPRAVVPIAPTWEENALMVAECDINLGNIDAGLQLIDAVRASQTSGLPKLAGSGISADSALVQLHSERRIGLYLHNTSWYDARRWGINEPVAQGGGRTGNVLIPGTLIGPTGTPATLIPCKIDYSFSDYWDVPQNELDFNPPSSASAPVKN